MARKTLEDQREELDRRIAARNRKAGLLEEGHRLMLHLRGGHYTSAVVHAKNIMDELAAVNSDGGG